MCQANTHFCIQSWPTYADIPNEFKTIILQKDIRKRDRTAELTRYDVWVAWFGDLCPTCGVQMTFGDPTLPTRITIDHIWARGLGGHATAPENLMCVCRSCNADKSVVESKIKFVIKTTYEEGRKKAAKRRKKQRRRARDKAAKWIMDQGGYQDVLHV